MSPYAVAQSAPREAGSMGPRQIDLDASANAAPTPAVVEAVVRAMSRAHGNPSSGHRRGDEARMLLERARDEVAALVEGAFGDGVVFTSGCTEANNLVLRGFADAGGRILTSAIEHPSVLNVAARIADAGGDVAVLAVGPDGRIDIDRLADLLAESGGATLVSIQAANSETGVLQDLAAIAALVAAFPATVFHADAAQAVGKIDLAVGRGVGPDVVTMSGHKLHAPMGVGAVILADDTPLRLAPLMAGGEQEAGVRPGTQAVPAIAGLGAACLEWTRDRAVRRAHLARLHGLLEARLASLGGVTVNGAGSPRLPNVTSATLHGCDAMAVVAQLDARGIAASQGSACSTRRPEPSHVLLAMGLSERDAFSTIRLSLSVRNDEQDIERFAEVAADVVRSLRSGT